MKKAARPVTTTKASLLSLCEKGEWTKLLKRLQAGLSPQEVNAADDHGLTPLHHASLDENVEVVVALLEAGADASAGDDEGTTALHIAATLSNVALARALLDGGAGAAAADVNQRDQHGSTALHFAANPETAEGAATSAEVVSLLLDRGADAEIRDKTGKIAVDYAAQPERYHYRTLDTALPSRADTTR